MAGENEVRIGSGDFVSENLSESLFAVDVDETNGALHSTVYMRYGGLRCGVFVFGDTLKDSAAKTVEKLEHMGYSMTLVSGDGHKTTRAVGDALGIADAFGGKPPDDKALFVRTLQEGGKRVAMVGDGVNDAPALVQSDLAIAVHAWGQLGKEAADITLMRGDPEQLLDFLNLAKQVNKKIRQNLIFSLFYNAVSIPVAMSGLLTPIIAVTAMLLSSLSVTGNTLLLMRKYASKSPAGS
jgi:P-type E1-E2 ATPase